MENERRAECMQVLASGVDWRNVCSFYETESREEDEDADEINLVKRETT